MVQGQHDSQVPTWSQVAALPRASIPPLTVTVAMDITEDSDCGRTMGPDVALSHSSGSDVTMAPGGSTCHPNLYDPDPDGHMALKHQHEVSAQTTGLCMALCGNRSYRYQHRAWLLQSRGSRHSPRQQSSSGHHHRSGVETQAWLQGIAPVGVAEPSHPDMVIGGGPASGRPQGPRW